MADIRNDQYLHRPGAGRGAITPADPLEVLLYDGVGNPLLVKTPTGETRQVLGVAGYGYDGTSWRPVKLNASGQAEVTLTGSLPSGTNEIGKVAIAGDLITTEVIANAISVPAGADSSNIAVNPTGNEREIWIAVQIDKQPWSLYSNMVLEMNSYTAESLYPKRLSATSTHNVPNHSALSLLLAWPIRSPNGLTEPTTILEAKQYAGGYFSGQVLRVRNLHATDTATVTVRKISIWR